MLLFKKSCDFKKLFKKKHRERYLHLAYGRARGKIWPGYRPLFGLLGLFQLISCKILAMNLPPLKALKSPIIAWGGVRGGEKEAALPL
jgi:hypothetical protein